jgi:hypothetical protein
MAVDQRTPPPYPATPRSWARSPVSLAAAGANDFLQAAFAALTQASD